MKNQKGRYPDFVGFGDAYMAALPAPTWTREGETWRITPQPNWTTRIYGGMRCAGDSADGYRLACQGRAVAATVFNGESTPYCWVHLAASRLWIEDGRVVCWILSR